MATRAKREHSKFHGASAELHGFVGSGRPDIDVPPPNGTTGVGNQVISAEESRFDPDPSSKGQQSWIGSNQAPADELPACCSATQAVSGRGKRSGRHYNILLSGSQLALSVFGWRGIGRRLIRRHFRSHDVFG